MSPDSVSNIHPTAIVDPRAELGADVEIGPYCVIDGPVVLGDRTRLISHVCLQARTTLGEDCVLHPFVVLGHPPQDLKYDGEDTELVIGPRTVLREHVTMHLGTGAGRGRTVVGSDGYFMVNSHVGHDCIVGDHVIFANGAVVGGSCIIGDYVILGGQVAVHQNTRIGRHAFLGGGAIVIGNVIPFGSAYGNHAKLNGLNLVGLKRRKFPREVIDELRVAYRLISARDGTLQERIESLASMFPNSSEVAEIVSFMRTNSTRNLCLP